jgi:hypothetical protein
MTVLTTLTAAGTDTGPFNLYSDTDSYATAFATNIDRTTLLAGYTSTVVPDGTTIVRATSTGNCTNSVDLTVDLLLETLFNGYTPALTDYADSPFIFTENITVDNIVDVDKAAFTIPSTGTYAITLNNIGQGTRRYTITDWAGQFVRSETYTYGLLYINGVSSFDMSSGYLETTLNANDSISFDYLFPFVYNGDYASPDFYGNYQFQLIIQKLS